MPKLTVIATSKSDEVLKRIVESLEEEAGYGTGREVRKDAQVPGKYILTTHNGEEDLDSQSVRVFGGTIVAGKASGILENALRSQKISYSRYDNVEISNPNATDLRLPEIDYKPQVTYTP